jgi:hypothetical protein
MQIGETIERRDVVKIVAKSEATLLGGLASPAKLPCFTKMMP